MTTSTELGRRERKKGATRAALTDAAFRLFRERGYDNVTLREVAEAADVSVTTLMNHFPRKEALVFSQQTEHESGLIEAVTQRPSGTSVVHALREHIIGISARISTNPEVGSFRQLVLETPALSDYQHRIWMHRKDALAQAILDSTDIPRYRAIAIAHFVVDVIELATTCDDATAATRAALDVLDRGWE
jgi:AcrR family transcriptional regulator